MIEEINLRKHRNKGLVLLLVSIALIIGLFVGLDAFDVVDVWTPLKNSNPIFVILSTLSMSLAFWGMGCRWRALMPCNPDSLSLSAIVCAGLLLNYAAPGPMGELAAAYLASKRFPLSLSQALASGVVARLVGLISAALIGAVVWLCLPLSIAPKLTFVIQITAGFALLLGLGLLSIIVCSKYWIHLSQKIQPVEATHSFFSKLLHKAGSAIASLCTDTVSIKDDPNASYLRALAWSLFSHSCVILGIILLTYAFQSPFSFWGIVFTYSVTTAGAVLLFALPGSYLGWDALFLGLLLSTTPIQESHAVAIVAIVRIQQLGYMLLGGMSLHYLLSPKISSTQTCTKEST